MLAQTLRGSCSIRPTCLAQPHITRRHRIDPSRAAVIARQFATKAATTQAADAASPKPDNGASATDDPQLNDQPHAPKSTIDTAPKPSKKQSHKKLKSTPPPGGITDSAQNEVTVDQRKLSAMGPMAPQLSKARQSKNNASPDHPTKASEEQVDIMKHALFVLKDFKRNPMKYSLAKPKEGSEQEEGESDAKKQSLRSQFPPIQGDLRLDPRQSSILQGTLAVLKGALEMQAGQMAQAKGSARGSTKGTSSIPKSNMVKLKAQQRDSNKSIATKDAAEKTSKDSVEKASKDSAEKAIKDSAEKVTLRQKLSEGGSVAVKTRTPSAPPVPPVSLRAFKPRRVLGASLPNVRDAASKVVGEAAAARPRRRLEADSPSGLPRRPKSFFNEAEDENEKFGTPVHKFRPDSAAALTPIEAYTPPVPMVSYGLDRVLFNEGVYALQDPRTKVWNFDPYLAKIMPVDEFDFDALKEYITSSKDTLLMGITKKHNKKYTGSTSSMTSTMAHFHYLLSAWRPINTGRLSKDFQIELESFAAIQRAPAATFLNHRDGTYAIDADKQFDSDTILSMLGKSMEKLLTVPKDEFEKYRRSNSHQLTEEEKDQDESYHYTTYGDFMMRSQLDAYDPRLPGTGIFDLKTRAVVSIRMDALNYTKGMGYEIRQRLGQWESFEREYFDMMRAAFLKYSLQVRMGRMDGIFVAYHNTQRIFGFQYIPLEEMDSSMHGTMDKTLGDAEFTASLKLWNELLNKATERFPGQSLRVHVETRPSDQVPLMYFFAEPVTDDEIKQIQERKKEDVDKFREEVLRIPPLPEAEAAEEEPPVAEQDLQEAEEEDGGEVWEDIMEVVEKTMDNDAQGITAIREAIGDALEQSGLLRARSSEEAQGYIESLLKLIVDVDAESTRKEADVDTDTPDSVLGSAEAKTNSTEVAKSSITDEPASQNTAAMESTPVAPPAPRKSAFGFLSSLFGTSSSESKEAPATQKIPTESSQEAPRESSNSLSQEPQKPAAQIPESADATSSPETAASVKITADVNVEKDTDSDTSAELVELIVKLTSYAGTKAPAIKDTAERPEDLAKLDLFRSILLDMMPKADTAAQATDTSAAELKTPEQKEGDEVDGNPEPKPIFGMVLTIRNKLNGKPVDRVEDLKPSDHWQVEYRMEEITDQDKARALYKGVQTRRRAAFFRDPMASDRFDAFGGALKKYTASGRKFRQTEDKDAKKKPVWIMGKSDPEDFKTVFSGAGISLDYVTPNPTKVEETGAVHSETGAVHSETASKEQSSATDSSATVEVREVSESEQIGERNVLQATTTASFREWRAQSKTADK